VFRLVSENQVLLGKGRKLGAEQQSKDCALKFGTNIHDVLK
jgi:hypothetical protein